MDQDLKNRTRAELREMAAQYAAKAFLGDYIFSFIHAKQARSIQDITPLSQAFRAQLLEAGFGISRLETVIRYKRGQTINAACGQLGAMWPQKGAQHGKA